MGFPILKALVKHYEGNDDVVFIAMQTTFEGYQANTYENGLKLLKNEGLDILFAQDGKKGQEPETFTKLKSFCTPWTTIIDPEGIIRFNSIAIKTEDAIRLIDAQIAANTNS